MEMFRHEREPPPGVEPGRPLYESAVRKRSRKPCAAAKLGYQASNLESSRFRAGWVCLFPHIPLNAEGAIRTRKPRGLSSRGLPVAITCAYAAGDSNPELTD
jgi:hypothetical protein